MKIRVDSSFSGSFDTIYKATLQEGVSAIIAQIGEDFRDVQWVIFDADKLLNLHPKVFGISFAPRRGEEYGFCKIAKEEIWVSTHTLHSYNKAVVGSTKTLGLFGGSDLFTDVIIDELAHIKSRSDHGTPEYERTYRHFRSICYGTGYGPLGL